MKKPSRRSVMSTFIGPRTLTLRAGTPKSLLAMGLTARFYLGSITVFVLTRTVGWRARTATEDRDAGTDRKLVVSAFQNSRLFRATLLSEKRQQAAALQRRQDGPNSTDDPKCPILTIPPKDILDMPKVFNSMFFSVFSGMWIQPVEKHIGLKGVRKGRKNAKSCRFWPFWPFPSMMVLPQRHLELFAAN